MHEEFEQQPTTQHRTPSGGANQPSSKPALRFGVVLLIVIPLAILLVAGVAFFGVFDGANRLANWTKPSLQPVSGRVFYNDKPLANAEIETRLVDSDLSGARGTSNEQGRFTLSTFINGEFSQGAFAGKHQATVKVHANVTTLGEPPIVTPEKYASFKDSPLRIVVKPEENSVELRLEGAPLVFPNPSPPMTQRPPPGAGESEQNPPVQPQGEDKGNREQDSSQEASLAP